ncbi:MAG: hypothetical protein QOK37_3406 [Thermoanaerobaculia bacterium]|jgi:hypothetical protein|nr:hypothetical protein [Thermoanaerobaculia bacterium]
MQVTVLIALIAFVSGVVAAWVQHRFSRQLESVKTLTQSPNEAYVSLIKAISSLSIARRAADRERETEFLIMLIESKARIIMYGDPPVINSVARATSYASLSSPDAAQAFVEMIIAKRRHGGAPGGDHVSPEAVARLLLGREDKSGKEAIWFPAHV